MSMPIAVEKVEKGDRIVIWPFQAPGPQTVVVREISEGATCRALQVSGEGASFELNVPRGQTVDLAC